MSEFREQAFIEQGIFEYMNTHGYNYLSKESREGLSQAIITLLVAKCEGMRKYAEHRSRWICLKCGEHYDRNQYEDGSLETYDQNHRRISHYCHKCYATELHPFTESLFENIDYNQALTDLINEMEGR